MTKILFHVPALSALETFFFFFEIPIDELVCGIFLDMFLVSLHYFSLVLTVSLDINLHSSYQVDRKTGADDV